MQFECNSERGLISVFSRTHQREFVSLFLFLLPPYPLILSVVVAQFPKVSFVILTTYLVTYTESGTILSSAISLGFQAADDPVQVNSNSD